MLCLFNVVLYARELINRRNETQRKIILVQNVRLFIFSGESRLLIQNRARYLYYSNSIEILAIDMLIRL